MDAEAGENRGKERQIHALFSEIAPVYETMNHLLSFNLDRLWRRRAISRFYRSAHQRVLDVCCGTGELTELLHRRINSRGLIIGVDFCENMLELARQRHAFTSNIKYQIGNAQNLKFDDGYFDAVYNCFSLRNLADMAGAIREMARVTKPGGQVVIIDLTLPRWVLLRWYVTHVVPCVGQLYHGDAAPYHYLSASIRHFCTPQQLRDYFAAADLIDLDQEEYMGGAVTAVSGTVKRGTGRGRYLQGGHCC